MATAHRDTCSASPTASSGTAHPSQDPPKGSHPLRLLLPLGKLWVSQKLALHEQRGYKRLWHPFLPVPKRFLG